jgi:hypothetical protein
MDINEPIVWLLLLLYVPYTFAAASNATTEDPQIVGWKYGMFLLLSILLCLMP